MAFGSGISICMRGSSPVFSISGSRLSSIGRAVLPVGGVFMWFSSRKVD